MGEGRGARSEGLELAPPPLLLATTITSISATATTTGGGGGSTSLTPLHSTHHARARHAAVRGAEALALTLFGEANRFGKLPITMYNKVLLQYAQHGITERVCQGIAMLSSTRRGRAEWLSDWLLLSRVAE